MLADTSPFGGTSWALGRVQHVNSNDKWIGNANLPMSLNIPDPENNVGEPGDQDSPSA